MVIDVIGRHEDVARCFADVNEPVGIGRNFAPERPVVISETGADGVRTRCPARGFFSEAYA